MDKSPRSAVPDTTAERDSYFLHPEHHHGGKWQDRAAKRAEADERNAAWRSLTLTQQLAALDKRPGRSERQRERILAEMAALAAVKPEPAPKADKAAKTPKFKAMPDETPHKKSKV